MKAPSFSSLIMSALIVVGFPLLTYATTQPTLSRSVPTEGCSAQKTSASPRLAGCIQCTRDSCGTIGSDQVLSASGSATTVYRCMDYDKDGQGHCVSVSHQEYEIDNFYYPHEKQGDCAKEDCDHGTVPSNPAQCVHPG